MQRKLYLMKLMLKNEKSANEAIKQKIGAMGRDLHGNNFTMLKLGENAGQRIWAPVRQ